MGHLTLDLEGIREQFLCLPGRQIFQAKTIIRANTLIYEQAGVFRDQQGGQYDCSQTAYGYQMGDIFQLIIKF